MPNSKKVSNSKINRTDGQIRRDLQQINQLPVEPPDSIIINSSLNSQYQGSPIQEKLFKFHEDKGETQSENSRLFEFRRISKPILKPQKQSLFTEIRKSVEKLKQEISIEDYAERAYSGKESDFTLKDVPAYGSSAERKNRMVASRVLPTC